MDWLLAQFLNLKEAEGLSKRTIEYYGEVLNLLSGYLHKPLAEVSFDDILQFSRYLSHTGARSKFTIANRIRGIKAFYKACFDYELIPQNPAQKIRVPKLPKSQPRILSLDEAQALAKVCNTATFVGARNYNLLLFLLDTGLRNSEVTGLRLEDIRLKQAIPSLWVRSGKGNKDRQVTLHPRTVRSLLRYLPIRESFLKRNKVEDPGYVFFSRTGVRIRRDDLRVVFANLARAAGIPPFSPHDLRHTSATWSAYDGMNAYQLAAKLGHSSIQTTQIYVHMAEQLRVQWSDKSPIDSL